MFQAILITLLIVVSVFMIILILLQRGRGGGLAGAFGGAGGQSAFGTKAGDTFTVITILTAVIWFSLCISTLMFLNYEGSSRLNLDGTRISLPTAPGAATSDAPAGTGAPAPQESPVSAPTE